MRPVGVRARILLAAVLGSVVSVVLVAGAWQVYQAESRRQRVVSTESDVVSDALSDCPGDPVGWSVRRFGVRVWAYDRKTGASANPDAPALDPAVRRAATADGSGWLQDGGALVVAEDGPCSLLVSAPRSRGGSRPGWSGGRDRGPSSETFSLIAGGALVVGVLLTLVLTLFVAVWPLVRRLERLAGVAGRVGQGDTALDADADARADEIGVVGQALERAHARILEDRRELQARHDALETHLAAVAHDLRTPLAALQLHLEAMVDSPDDPKASLDSARRESTYVEALIGNLHEAARLGGGLDLAADVADLTEIVDRVGRRFTLLAPSFAKQVAVALPNEPVPVACRRSLAERAVANIVHNALVHGGDEVGIALDHLGDRFRLTVTDSGPALSDAALAALANRRPEAPAAQRDAARSRRDTGLGVAITNAVARGAGWTIIWENAEDGGLRVTIEGQSLSSC